MKKAIAVALAALFFLSVFLWFPQTSSAETVADTCYNSWERCRQRAFESDEGWFRTALMLTVCDLSLGKCLLFKS